MKATQARWPWSARSPDSVGMSASVLRVAPSSAPICCNPIASMPSSSPWCPSSWAAASVGCLAPCAVARLPWRNRVLGSPKALRTSGTVSGSFATDGSDLVKVVRCNFLVRVGQTGHRRHDVTHGSLASLHQRNPGAAVEQPGWRRRDPLLPLVSMPTSAATSSGNARLWPRPGSP